MRKAKELPRCGATAAGTSGVYILKLLEETLGVKFNIVSGYQGVREIDLGVERGELHCRAMTTAAYLAREPYFHLAQDRLRPGASPNRQNARSALRRRADDLRADERTQNPRTRASVAYHDPRRHRLRPADRRAAGRGRDKTKILREAFTKSMHDPELLADAKKQNLEITPTSGDDLEILAKQVIASQNPEVIERVKRLLGE